MRTVHIRDKLTELGILVDAIPLGDFDVIGDICARKTRSPGSENYIKAGAFFRPNYERGILIDSLIRQLDMRSFLEIGFGRGYGTVCAARAFATMGVPGRVVTVDPVLDKDQMSRIANSFPKEWLTCVTFLQGTSEKAFEQLKGEKYDLIYIDGDHTEEAVRKDWESAKGMFNKCLLFDDYHLPTKDSGPGIQVAKVVDEIDDPSKELIIMDRRLFVDDRRVPDDQIDHGQVLLTRAR